MSSSKFMYLRNIESVSLHYLHVINNLQSSTIVLFNFNTFKTLYPDVAKYHLILSMCEAVFPNLGKTWGLWRFMPSTENK